MNEIRSPVVTALIVASLAGAPLAAQQLDVTHPPRLGPPAALRVPKVQTATLPNGLKLDLIELHEVPVVQFTLAVDGGGRDDGRLPGLASFTAGMLDEGADTLDAFGIAAQSEYLGAQLGSQADWDRSYVSLKVPRRTMGPALDLMAALALRPTFRAAEVARQRDLRLAAILQQRDEPSIVARAAFGAIVFPDGHPYHKPLGGDSAATAQLDSATVRAFWQRTFRPDRATLLVAGDITLPEARRLAMRAFGKWSGKAEARESRNPGPPVASHPTTVYLVDKPDAAQSVIMIGGPGVERTSPDYYALQVMNTILGGSFSSRLNQNLRETKGYTYGAASAFQYRPLPGPFYAAADVRSDVTDSSLVELFKELRGIRDSAVSDVELRRAKSYIALGLAGEFETASQLASQLGTLLVFGLPFDYYNGYIPRIMAVTAADVQRVARAYVHPDSVAVVVVGDVKKIQPGIEALKLGPIERRDAYGEALR